MTEFTKRYACLCQLSLEHPYNYVSKHCYGVLVVLCLILQIRSVTFMFL